MAQPIIAGLIQFHFGPSSQDTQSQDTQSSHAGSSFNFLRLVSRSVLEPVQCLKYCQHFSQPIQTVIRYEKKRRIKPLKHIAICRVRQETPMRKIIITAALLLAGCSNKQIPDTTEQSKPTAVEQSQAPTQSVAPPQDTNQSPNQSPNQPPTVAATTPPQANQAMQQEEPQTYASMPAYPTEEPPPAVSAYVDFPTEQPEAVSIDWAPPPMLVDTPPEAPSDDDVWTGGFWVWEGSWVWAHGRWSRPPHHGYRWHNPYYENRGDAVIFINGYWSPANVAFVPPPHEGRIPRAEVAPGVSAGHRPEGPPGVFVPPPPGSHYGFIVPAPQDTPPATVVGAPPMVRGGMHIVAAASNPASPNLPKVTIVAPASSTTAGRPLNISAPLLPQLAAAQPARVNVTAPEPITQALPAYHPGRAPLRLPPPVQVSATPAIPAAPQARPGATSTVPQSAPVAAQPIHPVTPEPSILQPAKPQVLQSPSVTVAPAPSYQAAPQYQARQPYEVRQPEQSSAQFLHRDGNQIQGEQSPRNPPPIIQPQPQPRPQLPPPVVQRETPPVVEERFAPQPRIEAAPQRQAPPQTIVAAPATAPQQHQAPAPEPKSGKSEEKDKR
jgi:hypothetical protein